MSDNNIHKRDMAGALRSLLRRKELGAVLPLLLLFLIAVVANPQFMNVRNICDVLRTASFSFIVAVPITFLMAEGQLDLSIGAITSLGGVTTAMALANGVGLVWSILIGLVAGAVVGAMNGFLVVRCEMPAFIATMGMQYAVSGLISVITKNIPVTGLPDSFKVIAQTRLWDTVSIVVAYALLIGIVGQIILAKTKFGRGALAVGGNRETAYLSGINVNTKQIVVFIAVGVFSALAGILLASRFASAQPSAGSGTELTIMASVIIGGTSMFGGSETVTGSAIGCVLFAMITNALIVMGVPTYWQSLILGVILIAAIYIDRYRQRASKRS